MATLNPFELLGEFDSEDPAQLIASRKQDAPARKKASPQAPHKQQPPPPPPTPQAKMPSRPAPPAQAVREGRNDYSRGRGRGIGRGNGRGRGMDGFGGDFSNNEPLHGNSRAPTGPGSFESGDIERSSERRGYAGRPSERRGGGFGRSSFNDGGMGEERPRRTYDRQSGAGHGNDTKRDGAGRGNWGTPSDTIAIETEEVAESEKRLEKPLGEEDAGNDKKESPVEESETKEPVEEKEMTLEEYEKVLEEKRKALQAPKPEGRKVNVDKEFESMKQLSNKKSSDDFFIKLGSDKDKRKEIADKEEKAKKSVSINEFLKPSEGERYHNPMGRGRGRGGFRGGFGGGNPPRSMAALAIEDPGQFPTLGAR